MIGAQEAATEKPTRTSEPKTTLRIDKSKKVNRYQSVYHQNDIGQSMTTMRAMIFNACQKLMIEYHHFLQTFQLDPKHLIYITTQQPTDCNLMST